MSGYYSNHPSYRDLVMFLAAIAEEHGLGEITIHESTLVRVSRGHSISSVRDPLTGRVTVRVFPDPDTVAGHVVDDTHLPAITTH